MRSELVDVTMFLHRETARAIYVSDDAGAEHGVWLPKSQCEFERLGGNMDDTVLVTLPIWLAREKGLI